MKNSAFLFILLLSSSFIFANKIDRLKTTDDVEEFVKKIDPVFTKYKYSKYEILPTEIIAQKLPCRGIFNKWEIKNWEKTDINNDGKTDLLYIMASNDNFYPFVIIDKGINNYENLWLSRNTFENCELFKPIKINKKTYLMSYAIKQKEIDLMEYKEVIAIDTLEYKFDNLVEFQNKPANYQIKSIEYRTSGCLGSCPVFSIKIKANGDIFYDGKWYVEEQGSRKKINDKKEFEELKKILNYIKVRGLDDNYSVPWTDDQTSYLKITFKDNQTKKIKDYGLQGTYGLAALYDKLKKIALHTNWD